MSVPGFALAIILSTLKMFGFSSPKSSASLNIPVVDWDDANVVITDLTVTKCSPNNSDPSHSLHPSKWHRIEKDLYLHSAKQSAWIHTRLANTLELTADQLVIKNVTIGKQPPVGQPDGLWESRPGGIWILKGNYTGDIHEAVTGVDILFGSDAVDPRPQWTLIQTQLQLDPQPKAPIAKLTIRQGRPKPHLDEPRKRLTAGENGKFKILQISDTHMVTGPGVCRDAIDADGELLPESEADPLTTSFIGKILDVEKPDLVVLTGDQLHHDILDSQSALFKVVAPMIARKVLFAAVFGNHDSEGAYALSRKKQMSILENLPFSLCRSGPEQVDGVGNYHIQISASQHPLATLYFLDSHGQTESKVKNPDYDWIKKSQIDWFTKVSKTLRRERDENEKHNHWHLSLAFMHIPLPEYADRDLLTKGGKRGEPTEGPSFNSHFYDTLVMEGITALACGHDHVNDFCGQKPQLRNGLLQQDSAEYAPFRPWLCYGGGAGYGGYSSYAGIHYHRRARIWELDLEAGRLTTWKRVEYVDERVDELVLADRGEVMGAARTAEDEVDGRAAQVVLMPE